MKESDIVREHQVGTPVDVKLISVIAGAFALLSPLMITLTSSILSIHAVTYYIEFRWSQVVIGYSPNYWLSAFPLTALRLIFVYQVFRYYENRSTRATTVLVGLVAELPMWIIRSTFLWESPTPIPTPFLVIFAIAIMWRLPYSEPLKPW